MPDLASRASLFPLGAGVTVAQLEESPHEVLAELRRREPVSWLPAVGGWYVTTRELASRVLRDPETFTVSDPRFSTAQILGPSMLSLDGPEHDRHRAPFADAFRIREIQQRHADRIRATARQLVSELQPAGTADLRRDLACPLAVAVIVDALGLEDVDPPTVLAWYTAIVSDVSRITAGGRPTTAGASAFAELSDTVRSTVASSSDSLLATIAGASSLNQGELAANVGVVMFGAIETSEGMTANALLHLLTHPEQLRHVVAEPHLVPDAVEESLRLEPAAAVVDRYATRDVELGGASITQSDPVTVSLAAANRDPATYRDPDSFLVGRENARLHLSFAAGPHGCLGMHMARLEAIAAVEAVLEQLDDLQLDEPRSSRPTGLVFRKPASVVAHWRARS